MDGDGEGLPSIQRKWGGRPDILVEYLLNRGYLARTMMSSRLLLPIGLHRTRVSEMRDDRVCAPANTAGRHPFPILERTMAVRLPLPPG